MKRWRSSAVGVCRWLRAPEERRRESRKAMEFAAAPWRALNNGRRWWFWEPVGPLAPRFLGSMMVFLLGLSMVAGGPALAGAALVNLPWPLSGPVVGFGVGVAVGALRATGPSVRGMMGA